ncbi:hypothetical protein [Streptomyces sp. NPDC002526]
MNASQGLRVVVTGATGNVGTSLVRTLARDPDVGSVLGLARRLPDLALPGVEWGRADLSRPDSAQQLGSLLTGAERWRPPGTHGRSPRRPTSSTPCCASPSWTAPAPTRNWTGGPATRRPRH